MSELSFRNQRSQMVEKRDPNLDPKAAALSRVYALLIRVDQQRKATQTQAEADTEMESVQFENETEAPQSRNLAHIPPPNAG